MRRTLQRLAPVLHLTRVTTAFAAVANVWFVILWTHATAQEPGTAAAAIIPLWAQLTGGAVNALGLFAFAAALNDVLDVRRDRTFHPERPIPSGQLSLELAVSLVVGTFIVAVLGATVLGTEAVLLTLLIAGAILFFNAAGRFIPAVGLVVLGLIYAGQMVVPNIHLRFAWPVWLVMTHCLAIAAAAHVVGRKVPALSRRAAGFAVAGWSFWSLVMIAAMWVRGDENARLWPAWVPWQTALLPAALSVLFVIVAIRKVRSSTGSARSAEKVARYGGLWLALYAGAWLLGQALFTGQEAYAQGALILGLLAAAGFLGMTTLREAYSLLEHPMGYRR